MLNLAAIIDQLDQITAAQLDAIDLDDLDDLAAAIDRSRAAIAAYRDRLPPFHPTDAEPRTCAGVQSYR